MHGCCPGRHQRLSSEEAAQIQKMKLGIPAGNMVVSGEMGKEYYSNEPPALAAPPSAVIIPGRFFRHVVHPQARRFVGKHGGTFERNASTSTP